MIRLEILGKRTPLKPVILQSPPGLEQLTKQQAQGIGDLPELPLFQAGESAFRVEIAIDIFGQMIGKTEIFVCRDVLLHMVAIPWL